MTLLFAQVAAALRSFLVDGGAVGSLIVDAPEVEAADAVGGEGVGEIDAVVKQGDPV